MSVGDVRTDLMRGTLDLLILRSLMTGPLHGLGIARRIGQLTRGSFDVKAGSLFPALYRLEERGLVAAEWGESDTRRRAKFYQLTRIGRKQLQIEEANWHRIALAMTYALEPTS
jgi:PadR family transcriptional regulator PadR